MQANRLTISGFREHGSLANSLHSSYGRSL
ncbi:hypothetical protein CBM2599_B50423 [Cupriavidus taiwanensis]|nr:hypothetical protein CBM2599_B50423 [Cupriavidus taiwanensis]